MARCGFSEGRAPDSYGALADVFANVFHRCAMSTHTYSDTAWRELPRDGSCIVADLFGVECEGPLHRHHVHPLSAGGPWEGRTLLVCRRHHPTVEAFARRFHNWKRCRRHRHPYPQGRIECELRLNGLA